MKPLTSDLLSTKWKDIFFKLKSSLDSFYFVSIWHNFWHNFANFSVLNKTLLRGSGKVNHICYFSTVRKHSFKFKKLMKVNSVKVETKKKLISYDDVLIAVMTLRKLIKVFCDVIDSVWLICLFEPARNCKPINKYRNTK